MRRITRGSRPHANYHDRLDIAKNVFQVHGIDADEKVVVRKQLRRSQVMHFFEDLSPCLVGLEACATSHYWASELSKLGHEVRLMPAKDVKAYVKRNKNDAADAEAICEAVRRPTMRFVQVKSAEQQANLMQHRARDLLMQQRTQLINSMRSHLAELGIIAPPRARRGQGVAGDRHKGHYCPFAERRSSQPGRAGGAASGLADDDWGNREADRGAAPHQQREQAASDHSWDRAYWCLSDCRHGDKPEDLPFGRDFAAWIGLVPRQMSTGGKRSSGQYPHKATATCGASSWLARFLLCAAPSSIRSDFPGSRGFWHGDRSRLLRLHLPIKWLALPGR